MKRFHFPLRPVSVMRSHRELAAREALAAAIATHRQAVERIATARGRIASLETVIRSGRAGTFRPADGAAQGHALRREWVSEAEAQKQAAAAAAVVSQRREAWIEAGRALKVIVKLEENARAAHRLGMLAAEQGAIDELAGQRAARRSPSFSP